MEASVNLSNLRNISGGDAAVEHMLLTEFLRESGNCLEKLQQALTAEDEVAWRQQAHAFKGVGMNLGAEPLSVLCAKAQSDWRASSDDKQIMLKAIETEFILVQAYLHQEMAASPKA